MKATLLARTASLPQRLARAATSTRPQESDLLKTGAIELEDGLRVWFRPIRPDDAGRLQEFHTRLSAESQRMRFFSPLRTLSRGMARRFTNVDFQKRVAVVACIPGDDAIRGVARYEVARDGATAEIAFVVEDAFQGRGVGKFMLHVLARHARSVGVTSFVADVLPENRNMLAMFESCEFPQLTVWRTESVRVTLDIGRGESSRQPAPH